MGWYALFVITGKEEQVKSEINKSFDKSIVYAIVPKRKVPEKRNGKVCPVIKRIFPGYVLIKTEMNVSIYKKMRTISYLINILGDGSYYTPIDEEEMIPILRLIGEGEVVEFSKVYIEGSKIVVINGPCVGLEGIIKKVDKRKRRAKIELSFGGSSKMVDVGIEILKRAE